MPFELPVGHKFSCVALANAGTARELRDPIDFGDGLWVLFEPPFVLNDAWQGWLGSIQAEHLSRSNLVVLAHQPSATPAVVDAENQALTQRTLSFLYALFLAEVFHHDAGLILSGANVEGTVNVRQVSRMEDHYRPNGVRPARIDEAILRTSSVIAQGIRAVHSPGAHHERLRRGFHAWLRGVQEYYGDERLHQFVRSVEAVVKPAIGRSQRQFVHRCQLFAGNSARAVAALNALYELRNYAEHLHAAYQALVGHPQNERERIALQRAYHAQLLASHVYERIFLNPHLQTALATDADIEAFWALPVAQRVQAWGAPIDLETIATARFVAPIQ